MKNKIIWDIGTVLYSESHDSSELKQLLPIKTFIDTVSMGRELYLVFYFVFFYVNVKNSYLIFLQFISYSSVVYVFSISKQP